MKLFSTTWRRVWPTFGIALLLPAVLAAQGPASDPSLIVLLPAGSNAPAVVAAINEGGSIPYGLGEGNPSSARVLSEERPAGRLATWVGLYPDRPLSRFYRYIVLAYPEATNTGEVRTALEAGGQLESVEENVAFELHSTLPNDPFLGAFSSPDPNFAQWGTHLLRLPEAWSWEKGYAQIGVIDAGVLRSHPELQAYTFSTTTQKYTYVGGNVHEHLSYDWLNRRCDIDERDSSSDPRAGHGSHVTGILAAKTNNGEGVAGVCWNCGIQMQKTFPPLTGDTTQSVLERVASATGRVLRQGAQVINGSFGLFEPANLSCSSLSAGAFCNLLELAEERQTLYVASVGNDISAVEFPARDPRVLAVGGIERVSLPPPMVGYSWALWNDQGACPGFPYVGNEQCGSNFGPELDLVAPARDVVSSLYTGFTHNEYVHCSDAVDIDMGIAGDGYGVCRGTSMSAPFVTGIAALVRSANPLGSKDDVVDVLKSTASQASTPSVPLGHGLVNAEAAVKRALGTSNGETIANRLTPLFTLQSLIDQTYLSTTSPQEASARTFDGVEPYDTVGPLIPWYDLPGACTISPCPQNRPGASLYIMTTDQPPYPGAPPLTPLYKLRWDPNLYLQCSNNQTGPQSRYTYSTNAGGISHFKNLVDDEYSLGFDADGQLGYIYDWCEPDSACQPPGTVKVYRLYNAAKKDWVVVSELELAAYTSAGYAAPSPIYRLVIGYAYPNLDSDQDALIDGFERLLGTDPNLADSDCDGASDGQEALFYDRSNPNPSLHGYGDPQRGPCSILFVDGFESGNLNRWTVVP